MLKLYIAFKLFDSFGKHNSTPWNTTKPDNIKSLNKYNLSFPLFELILTYSLEVLDILYNYQIN